jgi:peptidoglycan pentaglycine glycine transferase (the first glycine)
MKSLDRVNIPFCQYELYVKWRLPLGERAGYEDTYVNDKKIASFTYNIINLKIGSIMYIPYGPVFYDYDSSYTELVINKIKSIAQIEKVFMVRLEPVMSGGTESLYSRDQRLDLDCASLCSRPDRRSYKNESIFQPRNEWLLDIQKSDEDLLSGMNSSHRHVIRSANKKGVSIELVQSDVSSQLPDFIKLIKNTANREGFAGYPLSYYESIFADLDSGILKGFLGFAVLDGQRVATTLILYFGDIAFYIFGGSSDYRREVSYTNVLHFESMKLAREAGLKYYNFGAVLEGDMGKSTWAGFSAYKRRFGGFVFSHGDFYDLVIDRKVYLFYYLYKLFKR